MWYSETLNSVRPLFGCQAELMRGRSRLFQSIMPHAIFSFSLDLWCYSGVVLMAATLGMGGNLSALQVESGVVRPPWSDAASNRVRFHCAKG